MNEKKEITWVDVKEDIKGVAPILAEALLSSAQKTISILLSHALDVEHNPEHILAVLRDDPSKYAKIRILENEQIIGLRRLTIADNVRNAMSNTSTVRVETTPIILDDFSTYKDSFNTIGLISVVAFIISILIFTLFPKDLNLPLLIMSVAGMAILPYGYVIIQIIYHHRYKIHMIDKNVTVVNNMTKTMENAIK